ncbi:VCBS domain-containing protein [Pseudomonas chlororaphis]|nr:VCBS domain-containing protein [Pseudomonas chlororaphis]
MTGKPGATVQLQDKDGNPVGEPVVLDEQGQGTVALPPEASGEQVDVLVKDGDQQSPVATVNVPLLAPQLGAVDPVTGELPVIGKPGASVQLQDQNGNSVGAPVILDAQGQGVAKVPSSLSGEALSAVQTSGNATSAASGAITAPVLPPVLGPVDALTGQLMLEGKPGATVQIEVPAGSAISVALDPQGKGSVILPSIASHESLEGTQTSGNLVSAPASIDIPVLAPRNGQVNDAGTHVVVNGKPDDVIRVKDAKGVELGSGSVGKDGSIEIALNAPQSAGGNLTLTAYDKGEASPAITIVAPVIDMERPLPPTEVSINPDGTRVLGKAKAGETVRIVNLDTQEDLGTFAAEPDGLFSANIPPQAAGDRLAVTVEKDGKTSLPAVLLVPLDGDQTPAKPFDVSIDATGTKVQGKGAPNTIALVKSADNQTVIGKGLVGPDGVFQVTIAPQPGGQLLNVALQNNDKVSASETVMTPYVDRRTPYDVSIEESGTQVTGKGNAGDKIRVKDAQNNEIGSGVVKPDGTFVVNIPKQPADQTLAITAQGQGLESAPAYLQTPVLDTDRPPQPAVQIDAGGTRISGKTEPGASVSVKDAAGNLLAGPILAGEDGAFAADIAKLPAGTAIKVVAEVAGKTSLPSELIVPLVDEATPPAPLSASISADGKSIFGKAAPNTQAVVKDAKGNVLGERTVSDDGSYAIPIAVQVGGTKLEVSSVSLDGESSSRPVSVLAPFQLAVQTQDVLVGLLIDPAITKITESEEVSFFTPLSTIFSNVANWVVGLLDVDPLLPSRVAKEFSVAENERVTVKVSNKDSVLNANFIRNNYVLLEKKVGDEWVKVQEKAGAGVGDILGIPVLSDVDEAGLSLEFETPGDYRFTFTEFSLLGIGKKNYDLEIIREPFVEGFASSAITNDLVLPTGAKLLKVNDTQLADEVRTVIQGKYGQLLIGTDGQASYVQDRNATPSDQTETFTYEASTASGGTLRSSFTIKAKVASVSGDLLSQEDASISSVDGATLSSSSEQTIHGKFGDLKIKADGQYTYTPKLSLEGLNETDTFKYVVRHESGETVTSTLNIHIADAKLVEELERVPTGPNPMVDPTETDAASQSLLAMSSDDNASLPRLNLQEPKLDTSKLLSLQPKDDQSETPLTVTLQDILQPDGTVSGSMSASVLDLPDSWKPDGVQASLNGHDYLHYVETATKKDVWVETGVSVI